MQLQNIFYYVRYVYRILDDILFQLNPFSWERYDSSAEVVSVLLLPSPSSLPQPHCMHACCRFSMFHHIVYIISLQTHTFSYLPISAISFTYYGWFVRSSSLLPLQTKIKIYILNTANTTHRFMHEFRIVDESTRIVLYWCHFE